MKLNVFDFDETIILFQSPNRFLLELLKVQPLKFKIFQILVKYRKGLKKIGGIDVKKIGIYLTKGISKDEIDKIASKFYTSEIKKNLNPSIIKVMNDTVYKDADNIIISGGFTHYIKLFAKEWNIKQVIANEIHIANGLSTGFINEPDCMSTEKVRRLKRNFNLESYEEIFVYSDCMSDRPLFNISTQSFLVKEKKISVISKTQI